MNLNESNLYYINNKYLKEMISYSSVSYLLENR